MKKSLLLGTLCALLLGVLAPAHAITLRYALKKGAAVQYTVRLAAASRASGMGGAKQESTMELATVYRLKVVEVTASGDMLADLEAISGSVKISEGEESKKKTLPKAKPLHVKLTPLGLISIVGPEDKTTQLDSDASFGAGSTTPILDLLSAGSIVPLAERDVKPGDTWESEFTEALPMPPLMGEEEGKRVGLVKVKSKLIELVDYKGRKCAHIRTTFEMPFDAQGTPAPQVTLSVTGKMTGDIDWYYEYDQSRTVTCASTLQLLLKTTADLPPEMRDRMPEGMTTDGALSMKANIKASGK